MNIPVFFNLINVRSHDDNTGSTYFKMSENHRNLITDRTDILDRVRVFEFRKGSINTCTAIMKKR